MPLAIVSYLYLPLAATLLEAAVPVAALHVALSHAMLGRGLPGWRVRDTLLVSPLFVIGVLLFFLATNHGLLRFALDVERGHHGGAHLAGIAVAMAAGLAMAGFGIRAVGKLY